MRLNKLRFHLCLGLKFSKRSWLSPKRNSGNLSNGSVNLWPISGIVKLSEMLRRVSLTSSSQKRTRIATLVGSRHFDAHETIPSQKFAAELSSRFADCIWDSIFFSGTGHLIFFFRIHRAPHRDHDIRLVAGARRRAVTILGQASSLSCGHLLLIWTARDFGEPAILIPLCGPR